MIVDYCIYLIMSCKQVPIRTMSLQERRICDLPCACMLLDIMYMGDPQVAHQKPTNHSRLDTSLRGGAMPYNQKRVVDKSLDPRYRPSVPIPWIPLERNTTPRQRCAVRPIIPIALMNTLYHALTTEPVRSDVCPPDSDLPNAQGNSALQA